MEHISGYVPNPVPGVIEMPRSQVHFAPSTACSHGLHVGTYSFAQSYGDTRLEVHVNPRDVVSVPESYSSAKMRVRRYKTIRIVTGRIEEPVISVKPVDMGVDPLGGRSDLDINSVTTPAPVKHPGNKEFDAMVGRAQRRRQNFIKYATKMGPWTLLSEDGVPFDGTSRKHWSK